jgi:hypothetical protein
MFILGGILFILLGLALMLWIKSPGKEEPITGADGKNLDGSISQIEKIKLGGVEQYLFIRGVDRTKPVMLFLHGGPGSPELAFMKNFNTDIEFCNGVLGTARRGKVIFKRDSSRKHEFDTVYFRYERA